jgi:hypothetical protein
MHPCTSGVSGACCVRACYLPDPCSMALCTVLRAWRPGTCGRDDVDADLGLGFLPRLWGPLGHYSGHFLREWARLGIGLCHRAPGRVSSWSIGLGSVIERCGHRPGDLYIGHRASSAVPIRHLHPMRCDDAPRRRIIPMWTCTVSRPRSERPSSIVSVARLIVGVSPPSLSLPLLLRS